MSAKETTAAIRSRGHWEISAHPSTFDAEQIKSLGDLERAVSRAHVELRGWDYPHISREGPRKYKDYIQDDVSFNHHREVWRLYQSGLFVHLFAMTEDWWVDSEWFAEQSPFKRIKPGELLEVTSTLYTFTEMALFVARLAEALALGPEIMIEYKLVGLENRRLQTMSPMRLELLSHRKAAADLHEYGRELVVPMGTLISGAPEWAIDQTLEVYQRFNWEPSRQMLVDDQRKLLERRL